MPTMTMIAAAPAPTGVGAGGRLTARDPEPEMTNLNLNLNFFDPSPTDWNLATTTESNACREFEAPSSIASTLNTPEVRNESTANNFDEYFSNLLNEPFNGSDEIEFVIEQDIMETNTDYTNDVTLYNDGNTHMPNVGPIMEEVWGSESFDQEDFGPCLSAAVVEGVADVPVEAGKSVIVVEHIEKDLVSEIENNDLLKWIIEDQQIDSPINIDLNISPEQPQDSVPEFVIEVKEEEKPALRDEDKYRKMREQNNEASRKCRMNRKRKLADVEKEAEELEARNKFLRTQLEDMEAEVANWKKKLLSDISNKAFVPLF